MSQTDSTGVGTGTVGTGGVGTGASVVGTGVVGTGFGVGLGLQDPIDNAVLDSKSVTIMVDRIFIISPCVLL